MNNLLKYPMALAILYSLVGCNKYLAVDPDNRAQLNSTEALNELLATAYPQASYIVFSESMSDNFNDKGIFAELVPNNVNRDVYLFKEVIESTAEDSPDFYWAACYKAIAAANQALKYITDQGNPSAMQAAKGEALLCRSYAHFMLGVFFARSYDDIDPKLNPGIPYVKEIEDVVIKKYDRGTVASMYDNIQSDLEEGIRLIDAVAKVKGDAAKYHFNKQSAYAFASRFYLFKKDYPNVIKYAKLLFPTSDVLNTMIRDIVGYKPLPYYSMSQTWSSASEATNLLLSTTQSFVTLYPFFRYGGNGAFTTDFILKSPPIGESYAWNIYGGGNGNIGNIPKFRSYIFQDKQYIVNVLFSADEVLFNWAEAAIMQGDYAQALLLFNSYLKKKVTVDDPSDVINLTESDLKEKFTTSTNLDKKEYYINALLDFKRREYAFEGMRWLDMIRHRIPVRHTTVETVDGIVVGANDPRRVLQLPIEMKMAGVPLNPR